MAPNMLLSLGEGLAMYRPQEEGVLDETKKAVLFGDAAENGKLRLEYDSNREIFRQGEPAESVFYLRGGMVEISVTSPDGKEAIVTTLGPGEFFGTRQHGLPEFKLADLSNEMELLQQAKEDALEILQRDPNLKLPEHRHLRMALRAQIGDSFGLAQIG